MSEGAIRKYPCILAISSRRKKEFLQVDNAKKPVGQMAAAPGILIKKVAAF